MPTPSPPPKHRVLFSWQYVDMTMINVTTKDAGTIRPRTQQRGVQLEGHASLAPQNTAHLPPRSGSLMFLAICLHCCPQRHHNLVNQRQQNTSSTPNPATSSPPTCASGAAAQGKGTSEGSILTPSDALKEVLPADSREGQQLP